MKGLKIENNKGFYNLDGNQWTEIDKINKDDLLTLLDVAIVSEFEMDDFDKDRLGNQAHQIIYKNIYEKFKEIINSKSRFKDESESMYKMAIEKYKTTLNIK